MPTQSIDRSGPDAGLPLFFSQPEIITLEQHANGRFRRNTPSAQMQSARFIPLILADIPEAAKRYPIVLTQDATPMPAAMVGLERKNYFIDGDGRWTPRCYVPAYVRKYPFVFARAEPDDLVLCIDSPALVASPEDDGLPIYQDGTASPYTLEALAFCKAYQDQYERTVEFGAALQRQRLLSAHESKIELNNHRRIQIETFQMIDVEALNRMPEATLADWQKNGYLALIHYIQQSVTNWQTLVDLAYQSDERTAKAA